MTCVVVLLGAGAYFAYSAYHHATTFLISAGCQAGSGTNAVSLDTEQASIAATIAGVAADQGLPAHAVTIAYATATGTRSASSSSARRRAGARPPSSRTRSTPRAGSSGR